MRFIPERNVGGTDRIARAVLALAAFGVAGAGAFAGRWLVTTLAGVVGVGLGVNAVTGFCGLNAALGIDTCNRTDDTSSN